MLAFCRIAAHHNTRQITIRSPSRQSRSTMEVVKYPDPSLRRGGKPITEFSETLRETAEAMLVAMYEQNGVGLAAPQVGLDIALFVMNPSGDIAEKDQEIVMVNPVIKSKKGHEDGEEGCLSFPGVYADVDRSTKIVVAWSDLDGEEHDARFENFIARVIQHELDHIKGVLFVDRVSAIEKLRIRSKLQGLEEDYKAAR